MRFTPIGLLFFLIGTTEALSQESVNASGAEYSGNFGTISQSIGQVVYHTTTMPGATFAEGVQQPYEISIINGVDQPDITLVFSAYPNPTTDVLHLSIGNYQSKELSFQLFDVAGKQVLSNAISESNTPINMNLFAMGTYYLTITDRQQPIKTFKIIKT